MVHRESAKPEQGAATPTSESFNTRTGGDTLETVTKLISEAQDGRDDAWDRIYMLLYKDLHQVARFQIRQQQRRLVHSPTSLISETWLRLVSANFDVGTRTHLISLIARAMRFVLLDQARRALAGKRGDGIEVCALDDIHEPGESSQLEQLLILDEALNSLASVDPRLARVVELRYFGGFNDQEIAGVMNLTERTVRRDWRKARAYLFSHLSEGERASTDTPDSV
ncbi:MULTISPECIES: ECF-type sigma factor [unclassified Lysobacter]